MGLESPRRRAHRAKRKDASGKDEALAPEAGNLGNRHHPATLQGLALSAAAAYAGRDGAVPNCGCGRERRTRSLETKCQARFVVQNTQSENCKYQICRLLAEKIWRWWQVLWRSCSLVRAVVKLMELVSALGVAVPPNRKSYMKAQNSSGAHQKYLASWLETCISSLARLLALIC